MNTPTLDDLKCLVTWPPGSRGEQEETVLVGQLLSLCQQHGFGRVAQLTERIEAIWRDPAVRCSEESSKRKHLAFLDKCQLATMSRTRKGS